ncbi:MAG: phosphate--acyl-ACP acyltransferase [Candidatus Omnitrophica bacterium CG11_big_fil_rev_8_21_14_0_20_42_13]|uniref:Phosphate acyltransferase n=1 Tax=Candidatus Ghiorseimicrobium undicola TaxID=1974746 RepID=A0A2H0LW37_9BACT|nr:MAG: phosphate--acyl-ACP acyltransferase [Candidatus Omnitrophica bacterium CG11_big_fil_rev_8_21_14_0_20_42_13]
MKIVVDAMGGDYAPQLVIEGAIRAVKDYGADIILVGDEAKIKNELLKHKASRLNIDIQPASEIIEMHEPAAVSVRKKRDSSIVKGINLIKEKKADAFVSAGNTGAVVCAATIALRLLPGIERPGISIIVPTPKGASFLIDVGANINAKPIHLMHYAIMSNSYCHYILNKENPTIGLLNVGEEETKGTDFIRDTFKLLEGSGLNFIGNVEGRDIFSGSCDIIICDGFVGNVVLKVAESLAETIGTFLYRELKRNIITKAGVLLLKSGLKRFKKSLDYSEYGGAPLLGVDGVVIIGHGRSNANAIKNAIRVAKEEVERKVNDNIIESVSHAISSISEEPAIKAD